MNLTEIYKIEGQRIAALCALQDACDFEGDFGSPVFGEGNAQQPIIMLIGEAPGKEESACGRPFVGKAGRQLDEMLRTAAIDRNDVFVSNAVKYRPIRRGAHSISNRTPSKTEVEMGLPCLNEEIAEVAPRVIATLGNVPLSAITSLAGLDKCTVGLSHGMPRQIKIDGRSCMLFPLYHPAASIYNRELKPTLEMDLIRLGAFANSLV